MKGDEKKLAKVLSGKKQFVIPAYQRSYSWNTEQWEEIWRPIEELAKSVTPTNKPNPYFIGSVVVHLQPGDELERYDVIDGQQRLTTLIVILAALRDVAEEQGNASLYEELDELFLRNKFVRDAFVLKILSQDNDASDMHSIVLDKSEGKGRVWLAYKYFKDKISELIDGSDVTIKIIKGVIESGLMVVEITTEEGDNPHRIFQTLNSTGVGLAEVDKLRSHFFMLLPRSHEKYHKLHWKPMEDALQGGMERFLLVDLVAMAGGLETTKKEHVYKRWQERLRKIEHDEAQVVAELGALNHRAEIFHRMVSSTGTGVVGQRVRRLNEWGATTHHTITFRVLLELDRGDITEEEAVECLSLVESYLVRRMLVGIPTNNLNRLFTSVLSQVHSRAENLPIAMMKSLSEPRKEWPRNQQLFTQGAANAFYKTQSNDQRQFVLRRFEEHLAQDGHVDWTSAKFTIEHFMPQKISESWQRIILAQGAGDIQETHAEVVHQVGNLTLTSLNSKLSNSPQERKQEILEVSALVLSKPLKESEVWGQNEIRERSQALMQLATEIWVSPVSAEDSEDAEFSLIERALAELVDGEWTSSNELAALDDQFDEDVVIQYVNSISGSASLRVLTAEGLPDVRFTWVENSTKAYYDDLLSLGVLASLEEKKAKDVAFVKGSELLQRIEEAG